MAEEPAHPDDPFRVEAVERLVEHQHRRVAEHRRREAEALAHPERVAARLALDDPLETRLLDHLVDPPRAEPLRPGDPEQLVTAGTPRMERVGIEQRPDVTQRVAQLAIGLPVDQRPSLVRRVEAEDHTHRGRLAGAVRSDEAGHIAGGHAEAQAVEGKRLPETLAHPSNFDRSIHASEADRPACKSRHGARAIFCVALSGDRSVRCPP